MNRQNIEVFIFIVVFPVLGGIFLFMTFSPSNNVQSVSFNVTPTVTTIPEIVQTIQSQKVSTIPKLYKMYVDTDYGFYMIRGNKNLTDKLNITLNIGDTIRFINDDSYDWPVYIYGVREDVVKLRYNYESISYTFNQSGTYVFLTKSKRDDMMRVNVT